MNKELEALRRIDKHLIRHEETQEKEFNEYVSIIEKALKDKEKKDKALEIIKTKLLAGCFSKEDNYSNYAMAIVMSGNEMLKKNMMTEKEYNLLKEVLL